MRVKTYIVETMPDAMLKIRKDLGGDAVILSTKKIKVGGFLGMFGKVRLEVIAGVDESEQAPAGTAAKPQARQSAKPSAKPPAKLSAKPNLSSSSVRATGRMGTQAYQRTAELLSTGQAENTAVPNKMPELSGSSIEEEKFAVQFEDFLVKEAEDAIPAAGSAAPQPSAALHAVPDSSDEEFRNKLLNDIQQMKLMMNRFAKEHSEERLLPEALEEISNRLKAQEVDAGLAEAWIKPAFDAWEASGESLSEAELKQAVREEISSFLDARIAGGISDTTRVVYVAGPTGVGKTTTIAKMAADQIFRNHKKVGFITADTYRIAAVEQLRTYATILNVPLEVVQSPGDMKRAASSLEDCDLIFMDTAGRNYLNELYVAELHSLLSLKDQSETCLVLSLTSKPGDMKAIAEHFSKYGLDKVIFTKLDETESCGGMFNLLSEYPLQLLYLTNGQNVPDDLLQADRELLLNALLGDESA
ncbi:flagellar biosynthesis protein FlhF [Paenibacillus pinistramenti]|uniref:flagellar biosynthesis protein FlhF n=1 Tax=Paenibacillus pinistramenti TaxID=1768003 RepID=UPI001109CD88|nr:flagellar biosynthesis protein FlhF [Paenibacillus pinistramenti]